MHPALARLEPLLACFVDGVFVVDAGRTVVLVNDAASSIFGAPRGALLGPIHDVASRSGLRERDGAPARPLSERALEGETVAAVERTIGEGDGERRIRSSAAPIRAEGGAIVGAIIVVSDVTEERRRVESVRAEAELRALFDAMPQLGWAARADGFIDYYNRRWYEYTGTTPDEMAGWGWQSVHDPALLPSVLETWRRSLVTGEPFEMSFPLRRRDGEYRWFLTRATPLKDEHGNIRRWVGVNNDIDDQRRARRAAEYLTRVTDVLSESLDVELRLERLADALVPELADWCSIDDLYDGAVRNLAVAHQDPAKVAFARELQKKYPPRVDASGVGSVLRSGRAELHPEITNEVLAAGARDAAHLALLRELGLRSAIVAPLSAGGNTFGTITLITAERSHRYDEADLALAEEIGRRAGSAIANARAYADAKAAVRLRDEFLSVAGHELRTPLTALQLQIESFRLALETGTFVKDPGRWVDRVKKAEASSERLATLIAELLDVGRIGAGRFELRREPLDLADLVRDVADRFAVSLERARCRLILETEPVTGSWDRARLDQVVTNLLANAIKFCAERPVTVRVSREDDRAFLRVKDEGIGIDPAILPRIFERFVRGVSERHYGGLGLGLFIARAIVTAHGGTITAESAPGSGTTFVVSLPLEAP